MCRECFHVFIGGFAFDVRREVWSWKDIHKPLWEPLSGNPQLHSRARDVRDCTLIRAGLTLLGIVGSCGAVDVYVYCRRSWPDLPKGRQMVIEEVRLENLAKSRSCRDCS